MRILFVWIVAITLFATVTVGWYIALPVTYGMTNALKDSVSSPWDSLLTIAEYATVWWGPIMDGFIFLWAIISSQQRDIESELYG